MDCTVVNYLSLDAENSTLQEEVKSIAIDEPDKIPFRIRLLENPQSPIALPGKINLFNHDCLHVILGLSTSLSDEAFVIGFTMGNDRRTNWWHVKIFKFFSQFLYPREYQFNREQLKIFDLGFEYGRSLKYSYINHVDFKQYQNQNIAVLRRLFGICLSEIEEICQTL